MKKTFQLAVEGKNPDRVLDAVKHEIRKYVQRERRRDLPQGVETTALDWKAANAAVGQFKRGHADLLKWEQEQARRPAPQTQGAAP